MVQTAQARAHEHDHQVMARHQHHHNKHNQHRHHFNATLAATEQGLGEHSDNSTTTHHLSKRGFSGRATFFAPGLGACGAYSKASDYVGIHRTEPCSVSPSRLRSRSRRDRSVLLTGSNVADRSTHAQIVALNAAQYGDMGAVSSWCFQTITISYGQCHHFRRPLAVTLMQGLESFTPALPLKSMSQVARAHRLQVSTSSVAPCRLWRSTDSHLCTHQSHGRLPELPSWWT